MTYGRDSVAEASVSSDPANDRADDAVEQRDQKTDFSTPSERQQDEPGDERARCGADGVDEREDASGFDV